MAFDPSLCMQSKYSNYNSFGRRTLASELSKSLAISSSDGNPPAVTSDASVNVQYDSMLDDGILNYS